MTQLSASIQTVCDFIRDASAPFMVIAEKGTCLFENQAMQRLKLTGALAQYFETDEGRDTLKAGARQSTPLPFSFPENGRRQRGNIRRITSSTDEVLLLVKIGQSARMAAFTMASKSEKVAQLQAYHQRRMADRFEAFFKTAQDGHAILNRGGEFLHANPALRRLTNVEESLCEQCADSTCVMCKKTFLDLIEANFVRTQIIDPETSRIDLSRISPSKFDATLRGSNREIPVSVTLASNGSESAPEFFGPFAICVG